MGEEDKIELHRGLRDVYIDRTKSSFIDGKEGKLLYRGYNIHDLAEKSTFGKRVLTFSSHPEWINLENCNTLTVPV